MAVDPLPTLATFSAIIALGFLGYLLFEKTRITDVLILIGFGLLVGPVLNIFPVHAFQEATPLVGTLALIIIMFDGGLGLNVRDLFAGIMRSTLLALLGFGLTVGGIAAVGHYWIGLDWFTASMLGTILGGTSGIIVMGIISQSTAHTSTRVMVSLESALTDVLCVIGTVTLISLMKASGGSFGQGAMVTAVQGVAAKFSVAIVIGLVMGFVWLRLLKLLQKKKYSYMVTLAAILALYVGTEYMGGNGAISVLIFGIVLGNGFLIARKFDIDGLSFSASQRQFQGEIAFLIRVFFFVYLGVILDPAVLMNTKFLIDAGLIVGVLLAARIVAVSIATYRDKETKRDRMLMTMLMPRGLAAVVLAGLPMQSGIAGTESFLAYAFIVLAFTNLVTTGAIVYYERAKKAPARSGAAEPTATAR